MICARFLLAFLVATLDANGNDICQQGEISAECMEMRDGPSVPVVVVEEHHHVVDYWFNLPGVEENATFNATLVHIDAHPDFAEPLSRDLFSPWPEDLNQLREALENDQFIVMAIRWGLIGRVINIYPSFASLYIGPDHRTTKYFEYGEHKNGVSYCICVKRCKNCSFKCETTEGKVVFVKQCKLKRSIEYIEMSIQQAQSTGVLQSISPNQPVLLDIDEDYFAVEAAFPKIVEMGNHYDMSSRWRRGKALEDVQDFLEGKFCARPPRVAEREQAVDTFLRGVVSVVLAVKELGTELNDLNTADLVENFSWHHSGPLLNAVADALCEPTGSAEQDIAETIKIAQRFASILLNNIPAQSINGLLEYGFCIDCDEVPRANYLLWLCMGSSTKDDIVWFRNKSNTDERRLDLHSPAEDEVETKMAELHALVLSELRVCPTMVTICRSLRDAYIPRKLWRGIEQGVVKIAKDVIVELGRNVNISYDRDCYWGAPGVPSRSTLPLAAFLRQQNIASSGFYTTRAIESEKQ